MSDRRRGAIARLLSLLSPVGTRALAVVVASSLAAAVFETIGVASILPFMAVVMEPDAIQRYGPLSSVLAALGADSGGKVTLFIGVGTIAMLAIGNAAGAANLWVQQRFLARTRLALATELFGGYMRRPYAFHVERDTASLTKVVFSDLEATLGGFLTPLLQALAKGPVALLLLALVVTRDPLVALGSLGLFGGSYLLIYRLVRARQGRQGDIANAAALDSQRSALEGLGGIKELRVLGREDESVRIFHEALARSGRAQAATAVMSSIPRFLIEVVAFGGIVGVTLVLLAVGDARTAIPTLALYTLAGYRLMPAIQQLYATAIGLRYNEASVAAVERDLRLLRHSEGRETQSAEQGHDVRFEREITLSDVTFAYAGAPRSALSGITVRFGRSESIGLVGRTGAGKTTLADLMLGLYLPTTGELRVDGQAVTDANVRSWRRRVGYVPQSIFLSNASVAQNIAFGVRAEAIDLAAVEHAARLAQADEFIAVLSYGYATLVGERGVRLSGGQRQRLGIARALYHDPDVLVFDEATSALDGMTEDAVMDAISGLSRDRTVVLIAHRLRTVEACDRIVMLDAGRIVADGPYATLAASSPEFQSLLQRTDHSSVTP